MGEDLHRIDDLFEKAVERHSELPADQVWEKLERALQKRKVIEVTRKLKRWRLGAICFFILSVGLAIYNIQLMHAYKKDEKEIKSDIIYNNRDGLSNNGNNHYLNHSKLPIVSTKAAEEHSKGLIKIDSLDSSVGNKINDIVDLPVDDSISGNKTKIYVNNFNTSTVKDSSVRRYAPYYTHRNFNQNNRSSIKEITGLRKKRQNMRQSARDSQFKLLVKNIVSASDSEGFLLNHALPGQAEASSLIARKDISSLSASPIQKALRLIDNKPINIVLPAAANSLKDISTLKSIRLSKKISHPGSMLAGIFYSGNIISTNIAANHPDYREDNYMQIKNHEKNRVSTTIGISVEKLLSKRLAVMSGISWSVYITDINSKPLVARRDNNGKINYRISTSSGYAYYSIANRPQPAPADSIKTLSAKSTIKYLSIPLGFHYHFYKGSFSITPSIAIIGNFKTQGEIMTIQSLEHTYTGNIYGLKSHYFEGNFGLGFGYFLSKKIEISVFPSTHWALSATTVGGPVSAKRNAVGVLAGFQFHF